LSSSAEFEQLPSNRIAVPTRAPLCEMSRRRCVPSQIFVGETSKISLERAHDGELVS
jgi:hypothetical protein